MLLLVGYLMVIRTAERRNAAGAVLCFLEGAYLAMLCFAVLPPAMGAARFWGAAGCAWGCIMPRQAFCLSLFPYETHFLAQVAFLREYFSFRRYCSGKKEKFAKPSFFWYDEKENVQNSIQNKIFVEIEKTLRGFIMERIEKK